jgi:hypothetical protein
MKKKLITLSGLVLSFAPVVAFAQLQTGTNPNACGTAGTVDTIEGLLCKIGSLLTSIIPVLVAIGVIYFVWGVVQYVIADDEEAKTAGRGRMIYGIIGLAVIVAVWGLVGILVRTFVPNQNRSNITYPTVPF